MGNLFESHPAKFKGQLFTTIISFVLLLGLVGIVPLALIYYQKKKEHLTITEDKIVLKKGILSKSTNEVPLSEVSNITTEQGPIDRLMSVGDINIGTAATAGKEITLEDYPEPEKIKQMISDNK